MCERSGAARPSYGMSKRISSTNGVGVARTFPGSKSLLLSRCILLQGRVSSGSCVPLCQQRKQYVRISAWTVAPLPTRTLQASDSLSLPHILAVHTFVAANNTKFTQDRYTRSVIQIRLLLYIRRYNDPESKKLPTACSSGPVPAGRWLLQR